MISVHCYWSPYCGLVNFCDQSNHSNTWVQSILFSAYGSAVSWGSIAFQGPAWLSFLPLRLPPLQFSKLRWWLFLELLTLVPCCVCSGATWRSSAEGQVRSVPFASSQNPSWRGRICQGSVLLMIEVGANGHMGSLWRPRFGTGLMPFWPTFY